MPETGKNQPEMILGVQTVARKVLLNMPIMLIFVDFLGFWGLVLWILVLDPMDFL